MSRSNQINSFIRLMAFVIFLTIAEASHQVLIVKIKNGKEIIELNFQRKDGILANEHLPIWLAHKDKTPQLIPDVMNKVGEFVMYQDIEKTSAIVYIKAHDKIYGVIDTRFVIIDLPLNVLGPDIYLTVGGKYIMARKKDTMVKHLQNNYDILLSALLTPEEIGYVNSVIDQTSEIHHTRSPQFTQNEFHRMPSTPEMNTLGGHQYWHHNSYATDRWRLNSGRLESDSGIDSVLLSTSSTSMNDKRIPSPNIFPVRTAHEVPSTFFYPGIPTDNTITHRMPLKNYHPHVADTVTEVMEVDNNQYESQKFAENYEQPLNILYPEVLVFVTHDMFSNNINIESVDEIAALVQQYLIYFNAIDMLFAKLAKNGVYIHINIAGLVIEADPGTFPYTYVQGTSNQIDVVETMSDFPKYIVRYRNIFSEDSFDFFYLSTSHALQRMDDRVAGIARLPFQIYENRLRNRPFAHILGTIIQHDMALSTYIGSTHEIAHLMYIEHDPPHEFYQNEGTVTTLPICNAIMQERDGFCQHCAIWSEKSIMAFKSYIRKNRNHCFLLNYPRSLNAYGHPMPTLSVYDQCICYGFNPLNLDRSHLANSCNVPLTCGHSAFVRAILPLDGTPCDISKICWKKQCLYMGEPAADYKEQIKENQPPQSPTRNTMNCQRLREFIKQ